MTTLTAQIQRLRDSFPAHHWRNQADYHQALADTSLEAATHAITWAIQNTTSREGKPAYPPSVADIRTIARTWDNAHPIDPTPDPMTPLTQEERATAIHWLGRITAVLQGQATTDEVVEEMGR